MKVFVSIETPLRPELEGSFATPIEGFVTTWEAARRLASRRPELVAKVIANQLPPLPWKGGVEKKIKGEKFGTFEYLAYWQGLRNEDLSFDTNTEVSLTCSATGQKVVFTADKQKYMCE